LKVGDIGYLPNNGRITIIKITTPTEAHVQLAEKQTPVDANGTPRRAPRTRDNRVDAVLRGIDTTTLSERGTEVIDGCFDVVEFIQIEGRGRQKIALPVLEKFDDSALKKQLPTVVPPKEDSKNVKSKK
jgi:hypothetical protein